MGIKIKGKRVFFMQQRANLGNSAKLSNGKWIFTNYSSNTIVEIIGKLCQHCNIPLGDVIISYKPKSNNIEHPKSNADRVEKFNAENISNEIPFNPSLIEIITSLMSKHFPYGFIYNSPIELFRIRRFATEDLGEEIPLSDEDLLRVITTCGTFFDGKIYVVNVDIENKIKNHIDLAFSSGAEIIFYSSFYALNEEWLIDGKVISEEMLKKMLIKLYPEYSHKKDFFSPKEDYNTECSKIKDEILRVWGSNNLLSFEQLAERLPYIPFDKIKFTLSHNSEFVKNSKEVYTHVSNVYLTDDEREAISDYVATAIQRASYITIDSLPIDEIAEHNRGLTHTAIQSVIFETVLSDAYDRHGKIINLKGENLNATKIIKEFCQNLDKCSLKDLIDLEIELTRKSDPRIPMKIAYSVMVRLDKNYFVSEKYVHFDIDDIDKILDLFITGEYIPLKSIITFSPFPSCGQPWSLFLLESYCRRFSEKFRFDVLDYNSKNAGAIIRKSNSSSYIEIMADALAKSDMPCEEDAANKFLYEKGYTGKSKTHKVSDIVKKAKAIRERSI